MIFEELEEIEEYCMNKPCVYESRPFGPDLICYRIAGKIFCQLSNKPEWFKVTLKTNPEAASFYRQAFPGVIVRGYHCPPVQQPYWNTANLADISKEFLFQMIDEAYDEVINRLTKKERKQILVNRDYSFKRKEKTSDYIGETIELFKDDKLVGFGNYGFYDEDTIEIKEIQIDEEYSSLGLVKELQLRLEADARIQGFRYALTEDAICEKRKEVGNRFQEGKQCLERRKI